MVYSEPESPVLSNGSSRQIVVTLACRRMAFEDDWHRHVAEETAAWHASEHVLSGLTGQRTIWTLTFESSVETEIVREDDCNH